MKNSNAVFLFGIFILFIGGYFSFYNLHDYLTCSEIDCGHEIFSDGWVRVSLFVIGMFLFVASIAIILTGIINYYDYKLKEKSATELLRGNQD